jgi:hypothetical protein
MVTDAIKQIIENLEEEEGAEKQLISLYLTLLEAGAENCLPKAKQDNFRSGLDIVYKESVRHQKVVGELLKKYQSEKISFDELRTSSKNKS